MSKAKRNWTIQSHRLWSHQQIKACHFCRLCGRVLLIDIPIYVRGLAKELELDYQQVTHRV